MADKDLDGPSLELPSFGFGRSRRKQRVAGGGTPADRVPEGVPERAPGRVLEPEHRPTTEPAPPAPRERREVRFPTLPALPAVLLVGAVVGLAAVLLTYGSLRLCDVATGTPACGGGPGFLLLVAILIALTYLGGWLLRGFGVGDAGSTSFLAVGLLAVVVMLFLLESLDEWWTAVAVCLVATLAYGLSWWVTTTIVEADPAAD